MKQLLITSLILGISIIAQSQEIKPDQSQNIKRKGIEWCDIWIPAATQNDKPRVLLIGDSITKGYYNSVCSLLKGKAFCARFATSACVADPAFHVQLQALFSHYKYDIIHFNNGLHGIGYTEKEYQAGYEKALKYIQKVSPESRIILALSTPLNSKSKQNNLNPRINKRNIIVRELGRMYGTEINDLHSISNGHPEYYVNPYHYNKQAIELQGKQVANKIEKLLIGEQKNPPDKK